MNLTSKKMPTTRSGGLRRTTVVPAAASIPPFGSSTQREVGIHPALPLSVLPTDHNEELHW